MGVAGAHLRRAKTDEGARTFVPSRWIVMITRASLAIVALIALGQTAVAGVPLFAQLSCGVVRFYVSKYSEATAEKWARGQGAGEAEIEKARRCLHPANVQTANSAVRSAVLAPITEQARAQDKPAERHPDQEASVQSRRANPELDKPKHEPPARGFIRRDAVEDRSARNVSHKIKDRGPSDRRTAALRPGHVGTTHRAGGWGMTRHAGWLKRVWSRLTRPHQFSIAFLQFRDGRR